MNRANRQAKLHKYIVTLKREVAYTATMEVEARSVEEAEGIAEASVDNDPKIWREEEIISGSTKGRLKRASDD